MLHPRPEPCCYIAPAVAIGIVQSYLIAMKIARYYRISVSGAIDGREPGDSPDSPSDQCHTTLTYSSCGGVIVFSQKGMPEYTVNR